MRVLVNNIPHDPRECLFSIKVSKKDKTQNDDRAWCYNCSMNNKPCDLEHHRSCHKLRCIF